MGEGERIVDLQTSSFQAALYRCMEIYLCLWQVLEEELHDLEANEGDFLQALSTVHSRVFIRATESADGANLDYVIAPGIDMANHSFWPNASVQ